MGWIIAIVKNFLAVKTLDVDFTYHLSKVMINVDKGNCSLITKSAFAMAFFNAVYAYDVVQALTALFWFFQA